MRRIGLAGGILAVASVASGGAAGQGLDREAIGLIQETARMICGEFDRTGFSKSAAVEGRAEAALSGLAGQLLDLGIEGAGKIDSAEYAGVLQSELGGELRDVRACNLKVWDDLRTMISAPASQDESRRSVPVPPQDTAGTLPDRGGDIPDWPEPMSPDPMLAGMVNFGPYLNCVVYNPEPYPVTVTAINYGINGAFGYQPVTIPCAFNCVLGGYGGDMYSGPVNNPGIYQAECWVSVMR